MRITEINVQNFLGVPHFSHQLTEPVMFIAGGNGVGKSSLLEAVRFALTGEHPRGVRTAGDRVRVVTDGASTGFVDIAVDGANIRRAITSAKVAGDMPQMPEHLGLSLDAPRFASMPDIDRRRLLFALAGVKVDARTVKEQLQALPSVIPESVIDKILPKLAGGFPAAAAFAKDQAKEERGGWKAITGEVYGSKKADDWAAIAEGEAPTAEEIADAGKAVALHQQRCMDLAECVGRVKAAISEEQRAEFEAKAAGLTDAEEVLAVASDVYDHAAQEAQNIEWAAKGHTGNIQACPCCGEKLKVGAMLAKATEDDQPKATPAQVTAAKARAHDAYSALQNARRAVSDAKAARSALDNLPPPPSAEDLKAPAKLEEEQQKLIACRQHLEWMQAKDREHSQAERRTSDARQAHAMVQAWSAAEDALSPDGIPSILLSKALDPINQELATVASMAEWQVPVINRDLSLSYGGRPYELVSESEQWRADAVFATVIASLSGSRVLLLDRFDVLEPHARGDALDMLTAITGQYVDTALVAGTLKAKPDLGEGIDVVWLER